MKKSIQSYSGNNTVPNAINRIVVRDESSLASFCGSVLFHIIVAIVFVVGIPSVRHDFDTDYAIIADVVPISELTNVRIKESDRKDDVQQQTKKAPKSIEVAKASPVQEKPEDSKKAPTPENAEKIPDKNIKKEEKPKEPEKPKQQDKKKDDKKDDKKKKKDDDFASSIMKSIEEEQKKKQQKKVDKEFKEVAEALKGDTNKDYNPNLPMTLSEKDSINSQISRNWNTSVFSGSVDVKNMQVVVHLKLDIDGNVLSVKARLENNSSPYYRPFVESVERAVKLSSPLQNLPKDKYHAWKELELRFDPSKMIY